MLRDILVGARGLVLGPVLNVFRNGKVGDRAPGEGRLDCLIDRIGGVTWPHDALVVDSNIDEQLIEINILLMMRPNKIVEGMARKGEDRLAVEFGIIQPIEQVDAPWT